MGRPGRPPVKDAYPLDYNPRRPDEDGLDLDPALLGAMRRRWPSAASTPSATRPAQAPAFADGRALQEGRLDEVEAFAKATGRAEAAVRPRWCGRASPWAPAAEDIRTCCGSRVTPAGRGRPHRHYPRNLYDRLVSRLNQQTKMRETLSTTPSSRGSQGQPVRQIRAGSWWRARTRSTSASSTSPEDRPGEGLPGCDRGRMVGRLRGPAPINSSLDPIKPRC